jgi:hypothetical protein
LNLNHSDLNFNLSLGKRTTEKEKKTGITHYIIQRKFESIMKDITDRTPLLFYSLPFPSSREEANAGDPSKACQTGNKKPV